MSGNFNRSPEILAAFRAGIPEILAGLASASGEPASAFSITCRADEPDADEDNLTVYLHHLPTGARMVGSTGWAVEKYDFRDAVPRFKRSGARGLAGLFPTSEGKTPADFCAGFSRQAMRKDWRAFGRKLWQRAFRAVVEGWHLVTAILEREEREDQHALAECEKLRAMGWTVEASLGGRGWWATHPDAESIELDPLGRAKPHYPHLTFDPEMLAAFFLSVGKSQ